MRSNDRELTAFRRVAIDWLELGENISRDRQPSALETLSFAQTLAASRWVAPLLVRPGPDDDRFTIICGERRLRALRHLADQGQTEELRAWATSVIVEVREVSVREAALLNACENASRDELTLWERISTVKKLIMLHSIPDSEVAARLRMSISQVRTLVNFSYRLHPDILAAIRNGAEFRLTTLRRWITLMFDQQIAEWKREPPPPAFTALPMRSRTDIARALAMLGSTLKEQYAAAWLRWVIREHDTPPTKGTDE